MMHCPPGVLIKKTMNSFEALTLMKQKMNDHFDPKLLNAFIRLMGPDM